MNVLQTAPESLFWYWISERHAIYLKRQAGLPKPWTTDPILQKYKFTNPFRENDRGTVWLRKNFLEPHRDDPLELIAFNICWYRMFNWTGTGHWLGWQTEWKPEEVKASLREKAASVDPQVFTGAHIVRSAFGVPKIDSIVDVCTDLWHMCVAGGALVTCCQEENSLQAVFNGLIQVKYVGPFMAYEMVTDMRHTRLLENATDIMTWANPGPGAQRGLQRLELASRPDSAAIEAMRYLLKQGNLPAPASPYWAAIPDGFRQEQFPHLEMRDIEMSLCEFDKYVRVQSGEGAPRGKYNGLG